MVASLGRDPINAPHAHLVEFFLVHVDTCPHRCGNKLSGGDARMERGGHVTPSQLWPKCAGKQALQRTLRMYGVLNNFYKRLVVELSQMLTSL